MERGIVKWFSKDKGFGFITMKNGEDLFFHISDVDGIEAPQEGQTVTYLSAEGKRGPKATSVVILPKIPLSTSDLNRSPGRVLCSGCGREMVPRMIISNNGFGPKPSYSVCPFCASTHENYESEYHWVEWILMVAVVIIFIIIISR